MRPPGRGDSPRRRSSASIAFLCARWPAGGGVLAARAILGFDRLRVRSVAAWEAVGSWGLMRGLLRRGNQIVGAASAMLVLLAAVVGGLLLHEPFRGPFLLGLALVPLI